jgi:phosphatidylglycerophosphate synthase
MLSNERSVMDRSAPAGRHNPLLRSNALSVLGCVFTISVTTYGPAADHLLLEPPAIFTAAGLLLVIFALVFNGLHHHAFEQFGMANTVTAIRAAIVSLIAAAVFCPDASEKLSGAPWTFAVLVLVALLLDGVDGYLARRFRLESDLGARFDMEVDALLIFCLSAAAFVLGKAGAWVLIIGLMRYGFVIAQYCLPRLKSSLAPSLRRKTVCVVQVVVLCLLLLPFIASPLSAWLAAIALLLLVYSFAIDCLYLIREAEIDG